MSLSRKNPKRDGNEAAIKAALKAVGATVEKLSGHRIGDLLVGYRGVNYQLEVKMPKEQPNEAQKAFAAEWKGHYVVVRTVDESLRAIGAMR